MAFGSLAQPCPGWEYDNLPAAKDILDVKSVGMLVRLKTDPQGHQPLLRDTRPVHRELLSELTPMGCSYYAGHYRGELFRCLLSYEVHLTNGGDGRVGALPCHVAPKLTHLFDQTDRLLVDLDKAATDKINPLDRLQLLSFLVPIAANLLQVFLTIHPYANGNGHMGRLLVLVLMARYDIWPRSWPFETRPPYEGALDKHRDDDPASLEALIYQSIDGVI